MTQLLERAREVDARDPLAAFRDRFVDAPGVRAYLDGNSLGRPLKVTAERTAEFIAHDWGTRLIRSWDEQWMADPTRVGDRIAEVSLGAAAGQTLVVESTSVAIYKLVRAAVKEQLGRGRREIVIEEGNFPTDRFIVESVASEFHLDILWVESAHDVANVVGPNTALVLLSHVDYRSGALADMCQITAVVKASGALMMWDLCHSVGVIPMQLDEWGVDLAVGCTYKYLNGGPGSPAFLYVASEHHGVLEQPIWGWWGAQNVFAMGPRYEAATDISQFMSGTPSILSMIGMQGMLDAIEEAGIDRIREKSRSLTQLALEAIDELLTPFGVRTLTPSAHEERGSHVSIGHDGFADIIEALWNDGIIPDFRNPDNIRLGLSPLSTSHEEVIIAIEAIAVQLSARAR